MSGPALTWAMKQRVGSADEKYLLVVLANFADASGVAYPSTRTLAEVCEISQSAVARRLRRLREKGLVAVQPGGGRAPSRYRLPITAESVVNRPSDSLQQAVANRPGDSQEGPVVNRPGDSLQGDSQARSESLDARSESLGIASESLNRSDQRRYPTTKEEPKNLSARPRTPAPAPAHARTREGAAVAVAEPQAAPQSPAEKIINDHVGPRPRPIRQALARVVAECLDDGIPPADVIAGVKAWDARGYAAASLPTFISQAQADARTPDTRSVWEKPPDEITDDELDAETVIDIIGHQPEEPCPEEIDFGPTAARKAWYVQTRTAELARNRIKARTVLARHWTNRGTG